MKNQNKDLFEELARQDEEMVKETCEDCDGTGIKAETDGLYPCQFCNGTGIKK